MPCSGRTRQRPHLAVNWLTPKPGRALLAEGFACKFDARRRDAAVFTLSGAHGNPLSPSVRADGSFRD